MVEVRRIRREQTLTDRHWRRLRTLELLHAGKSLTAVAEALGTYPREVRRVGWRYLENGLEHALCEDHRYTPPRLLDDRQRAKIVAMVCSDPPEGRARWTVALIAEEARRRRVVKTVSRETVRKLLADHDLKPWREKNVVRS
jgi:putative transposase